MKFTIPKGEEFYCEITVKQPGASVPMDLTGATGDFSLYSAGYNACMAIDHKAVVIENPDNGLISITLTAEETSTLTSRIAFGEDGYPTLPTYKGEIHLENIPDSLDTHKQPDQIFVEIPRVYVTDKGSVCPVQTY